MSIQNKYTHASEGFDRIAFMYDATVQFVSCGRINKSQLAFLSQVSSQQTCLILGGGTGYFLQKLLEANKIVQITYVDASEKMISAAKKRIAKACPEELHRIQFVCKDVAGVAFDTYDVIVCNYFLDLFDNAYVSILIEQFRAHLNKDGFLYITDFSMAEVEGLMRWSTGVGLNILYRLFKWVVVLPANQLPDIERIVQEKKFVLLQSETFFKGVLKCSLYKAI